MWLTSLKKLIFLDKCHNVPKIGVLDTEKEKEKKHQLYFFSAGDFEKPNYGRLDKPN